MVERRRMQGAASATRALPLRAAALRVPNPYPATAWRRGCRGAAAHRYSSAVRSPSCEGTLPLRPLLRRSLREGRRSRKKGGGTSMADPRRVADARHAPPLRDAALCPFPAPPSQPWQPSCDPLRSPTFVGGTRQAGQRSAQSGAAEVPSQTVGLREQTVPSASQPPSHDASINSSAVRHTPRVRPV